MVAANLIHVNFIFDPARTKKVAPLKDEETIVNFSLVPCVTRFAGVSGLIFVVFMHCGGGLDFDPD